MAVLQNATRANLDGIALQSLTFNVWDDTNLAKQLFIMPNMLNGQPLANYTGADNITTSASACTDVVAPDVLKEGVKLIEFKEFEVNATFCAKSMLGKIVAKGMKPDSSPDEVGAVISQLVANGAELDMLRFAWLGDTAIQSTALNAGVPLTKYNLKNGFYKQILASVAANKTGKVIWSAATAADILKTVRAARRKLSNAARRDAILFITSNWYDAILAATTAGGAGNAVAMQRLIDGVDTLFIDGIEVRELGEISDYIASDYKTVFDFGVLTPIENLAVPMDRDTITASEWDKDAKNKMHYLEAAYQADFKVANDKFACLISAS